MLVFFLNSPKKTTTKKQQQGNKQTRKLKRQIQDVGSKMEDLINKNFQGGEQPKSLHLRDRTAD